jgi:hypothetical protein
MRTNGQPLSNQRIADALAATGLMSAGDEIERFVMRGETIQLRPRICGDCAAESVLDVRPFDVGFDLEQSRKTGTIRGIREDSSAWQAGVREGQRWAPMDVVWGDPDYLAELEIRDGQGTRRVRYYPASTKAIPAPQYSPIAGRSCPPGTRLSSSSR